MCFVLIIHYLTFLKQENPEETKVLFHGIQVIHPI